MNRTIAFGKTMFRPPLAARILALCAVLACLLPATPAGAAGRGPVGEGSMRLSLILGSGSAFDQNYFVAGAGFGYFVADGLELGVEGESWSGSTPRIFKVSPQARYVFSAEGTAKPYVGAFYRRTIVEGMNDLNSAGARAGVYFLTGRGGYFGAGIVYENYFNCNETVFRSCTEAYPELMIAFTF